jgi:tetratricopeptide (TPR) repeat protein
MLRFLPLLLALPALGSSIMDQALQALNEGLPTVAVVKLQRGLLSEQDKAVKVELAGLLAESHVRCGQAKEALEVLAKFPDVKDAAFWEAQACLRLHDAQGAAAAFERVPRSSPVSDYAELGRVELLRMSGQGTEARSMLKPLRDVRQSELAKTAQLLFNELELDKDRQELVLRRLRTEGLEKDAAVQLLRARAYMQEGKLSTAESILRDLLASDGVGERGHDAASVMLAGLLAKSAPQKARNLLVSLVDSLPAQGPSPAKDSDYLHDAFLLLHQLEETSSSDTFMGSVLSWVNTEQPPALRGYALELASRLLAAQKRVPEAVGMLEAFVALYPQHPLRDEVLRQAAALHGQLKDDDRLLALAEQWRKEFGTERDSSAMDVMVASIRFDRQEPAEAMQLFMKVADTETDLQRRRLALYNAAICASHGQDAEAYQVVLAQLKLTGEAASGGLDATTLELDHALNLASKQDPDAMQQLQSFVASYRNHPRWAEAQLALAELCLLESPVMSQRASEALNQVSALSDTPYREQADYLRVWLREAEQDLSALTREGLNFVETWQLSPRCTEVLMKVAEAFYRMEDYSNAQAQFSAVTARPENPFTEAAHFYAGKAALAINTPQSLNEAITHWGEVATLGKGLAFAARFHQALAKRQQGLTPDALAALDELLADSKLQEDQRRIIVFEKADILIAAGSVEPARLEDAEKLLRSILAGSQRYEWQARALVLLASVYRELNRSAEALEAAYDAVNQLPKDEPTTLTAYEWYCRAGFLALDLLEKNQQWEAAAKLAARLAEVKGTRAKEATDRATRIRLEHFLWDGSKTAK